MTAGLDAVVVGSGPNGLAAAVRLAQAGLSVAVFEGADHWGGGACSGELTLPGFTHDLCSAVHPLAAASPFFRALGLEKDGLEWINPPSAAAHPLEDSAVLLDPSVERTAEGLGRDGAAYRRLFKTLAQHWEELFAETLGPFLHTPRHPLLLTRFGAPALLPADLFTRTFFRGARARALVAGVAAHSNTPLRTGGTGAVAMMLLLAAHARNWPVPRGGAQKIADALVSRLRSLGGEVHLNRPIRTLAELPPSKVVLFDLMPGQVASLLEGVIGAGARAKLASYRHGPGVFKIDWALSGPIPWRAPEVARAATVHLSGTFEETLASENCPARGGYSEKPYVLLSQPTLFDPSRAPAGKHTAWAYCHVPAGSGADRTEVIEQQVERFAPGFRDLILARAKQNCGQLEARNPNLVKGDIGGGALSLGRLLFRPQFRLDPYRLPGEGYFLCSSATPPGPGVHGMCGYHAAGSALKWLTSGSRSPSRRS